MAFPPEKMWDDETQASDAPIADHTEFEICKRSPADGICTAWKRRDSACPADGSVSSLHHLCGSGHGSFWRFAVSGEQSA
jgi:hypothetical protein